MKSMPNFRRLNSFSWSFAAHLPNLEPSWWSAVAKNIELVSILSPIYSLPSASDPFFFIL
jgi:hypothetical protein